MMALAEIYSQRDELLSKGLRLQGLRLLNSCFCITVWYIVSVGIMEKKMETTI